MKKSVGFVDGLFESIDAATLGVFRIGFGLLMFWETFRFWPRVQTEFLATKFPFRYDHFEWFPTSSEFGLNAVFTAMAISAAFFAAGLFYRISAITFFLAYTYLFLIEQTLYNNHYYLTSLLAFFFCVVDADASYSWKTLRPGQAATLIPFWQIAIFRAQLVIVYFYAGVAKINFDWLRGEPMRHMLRSRADDFPISGAFTNEFVVYCFAYGGMLFDLGIGFLLLWRKTRILGVVLLAMFHLTNNWMFSIGIFPWLGMCSVVVFFDPSFPRGIFTSRQLPFPQAPTPAVNRRYGRLMVAGFAVYFLIQVLLPLRHFLYPGNVSWTEEGHNFAWHMKLRSKDGLFQFYADTPNGRRAIDQSEFLTENQQEEIVGDPRLLRKFAEFLRAEMTRNGIEHSGIRVEAICSLNGRPYQLLVDSKIDLSLVDGDPFRHANWIVPLKESDSVGDYPQTFDERIQRMRRVLKDRSTAD